MQTILLKSIYTFLMSVVVLTTFAASAADGDSYPQGIVAKPYWYETDGNGAFDQQVDYLGIRFTVRNSTPTPLSFSDRPEETIQIWGTTVATPGEENGDPESHTVYIPELIFQSAPSGTVAPGDSFEYNLDVNLKDGDTENPRPPYVRGLAFRFVDNHRKGTMNPDDAVIEHTEFHYYTSDENQWTIH